MPRKGKRRTVATNIYADRGGLEAVARATVDGVELTRSKRYDRDTPIKEIRAWQDDTERELRKLTGVDPKDTFEAWSRATCRSCARSSPRSPIASGTCAPGSRSSAR
jgi:hypothetical protein